MIKTRITYWNNIGVWKTTYEVPLEKKNETIRDIQEHICGLLEGPGEIYWDKDLYGDNEGIIFKSENFEETIFTGDFNDFYHILDLNPGAENSEIAYVGINYVEE